MKAKIAIAVELTVVVIVFSAVVVAVLSMVRGSL